MKSAQIFNISHFFINKSVIKHSTENVYSTFNYYYIKESPLLIQ